MTFIDKLRGANPVVWLVLALVLLVPAVLMFGPAVFSALRMVFVPVWHVLVHVVRAL